MFWAAQFEHCAINTWNVFGSSQLRTKLAKRKFLDSLVAVSIRISVTWNQFGLGWKGWKGCEFLSFSGRFKHYNHVLLLCDFGCKRTVEESFCSIPFLAVLGHGSEGSTGQCPEEPEGKAQSVCWKAPHTHRCGRSPVCWTGLIRL